MQCNTSLSYLLIITNTNLSLISPNCDIPSVFELKQNSAKCTNYGCISIFGGRCDSPGRHQMLTVINDYYGYMKDLNLAYFC